MQPCAIGQALSRAQSIEPGTALHSKLQKGLDSFDVHACFTIRSDQIFIACMLRACAVLNIPAAPAIIGPKQTVSVQRFCSLQIAGRIFSIDSGIQFTASGSKKLPFAFAHIKQLMKVDNNELLWVAVVTPIRNLRWNHGVCSGIAPTHDLTPLPLLHVWLNREPQLTAANVVPFQYDLPDNDRVWLIPQY
jgi:hypothetical protein